MNYKEFLNSIRDPLPVYLLKSGQEYLRQKVQEACEKQVEENARPFDWNLFDLDIRDSDRLAETIRKLVGTARTLPWMSPRRWILVKNLGKAGKGPLAEYVRSPSSRTVLIVEASRKPEGWPRIPVIQLDDRVDYAAWVIARARKEGFSIQRDAAGMLVELAGEDPLRLDAELEKLFLYNLDEKRIGIDSVLDLTVESRQRDIFELIAAMARRDRRKALVILQRLFAAGSAPPQILSMLYWNFRRLLVAREMLDEGRRFQEILKELKIWSYRGKEKDIRRYSRRFLSGVLLRIRRTDRQTKTSSGSPQQLLETLIVDTCRDPSV